MGIFSAKRNKNQGSVSSRGKRPGGFLKKTVIVTGLMLGLFMVAPMANNSMLDNAIGVETAYAAELPYSHRWETQADGNWKYKMDEGGYATSAWVRDEVDGNWYLLSETGVMRSGIFESYGKYYLLSEVHDGHFGHLVKNGEVYNGVTIKADTSEASEGALSQESIDALKGLGYQFSSVTSVTGTQHVSDGKVTTGTETQNTNTQSNQGNSDPWANKAPEDADIGTSSGVTGDGVVWG